MSVKRGDKEQLLNLLELDILVNEVGEKLSPEVVAKLLTLDSDSILTDEQVFSGHVPFNRQLDQITTLNYNLKKSQISRNLHDYPHF